MIEPFKITWCEPVEGPVPAGTKVRRATGLVGELRTSARVRSANGGDWRLVPEEGAASFLVDAGGREIADCGWWIDAVGLRDDGLLWVLPRVACQLPEGTPVRFGDGRDADGPWSLYADWSLKPDRLSPALITNDGGRTILSVTSPLSFALPRPFPHALDGGNRCDECGQSFADWWRASLRSVGGAARYTVCSHHDVSDIAFLKACTALRERERRAERLEAEVRAFEALNPMSEEEKRERARALGLLDYVAPLSEVGPPEPIVGEWVEGALPKTGADRRAAKVAVLLEALSQPMAPRFGDEQERRKR